MKQFELEQSILDCWHVTDDIDLLYHNVMENNMSVDDIANTLLGIKHLYNMRFNKCWNDFEGTIEEYRMRLKNNEM